MHRRELAYDALHGVVMGKKNACTCGVVVLEGVQFRLLHHNSYMDVEKQNGGIASLMGQGRELLSDNAMVAQGK